MPRLVLLVLLVLLPPALVGGGGAGPLHAQEQEVAFPPLTGRVVDRADLLSEVEEAEIAAALAAYERETTNQIVVVTLDSLQGLPIEDYGYRLGRHWGVGREGEDNGALLIVAPEERAVRIEVGYGLEGELTDALGRTIIEAEILPRFRQGDFAGGIEAGVSAMLRALGGTYEVPRQAVFDRADETRRDEAPGPFALLPALPILLVVLFNALFGRRRRGRGRYRRRYGGPIVVGGFGGGGGRGGGGFGGGGGFSGGGGSFGGGGATGRW